MVRCVKYVVLAISCLSLNSAIAAPKVAHHDHLVEKMTSPLWAEQMVYRVTDSYIESNFQFDQAQIACFVEFFDTPAKANEMPFVVGPTDLSFLPYPATIWGPVWNEAEDRTYKGYKMEAWVHVGETMTSDLCKTRLKEIAQGIGYEFRLTFFKVRPGMELQ